MGLKLNLGCGACYLPGYLNVDRNGHRIDVKLDLNHTPWPWPSESISEVRLIHVLEHLDNITAAMHEIWRVLQPGGQVIIHVPHFTHFQALTHPEHKHAFHYNSFEMFTAQASESYTKYLFKYTARRLEFGNPLWNWIFNRHPYLYTSTALAYLLPAKEIQFMLSKVS